MTMQFEPISSGFRSPEVFTDLAYEYSGSQHEKEKKVRADLLMFNAISAMGKRPSADEFNRAMRKMDKAVGGDVFGEIVSRVNNANV